MERTAESADGRVVGWNLIVPYSHSPRSMIFVVVAACEGERPRLSNGCITGRIAREDDSLQPETEIIVVSHTTGSFEWWLHPQCRAD